MLKTVIVLPDGTEISSGHEEGNAIQTATITKSVNDAQDLSLGSACASKLSAVLISEEGSLTLYAGEEITVLKEDQEGNRIQVGVFILEKPTRPSPNKINITAYDRIVLLDRDISEWFSGLDGWPYSIYTLATMVCEACDLTLENESLPNGDHLVSAFSASGITGRALMQWIGQACGRFCRATPTGTIEFAWYYETDIEITPGGDLYYFQNGLTYEDYEIYPIEKVQIHQNEDDVGVVWPDETGEKNTYIITGNYLLTTEDTATLQPVAQTLYTQLQTVRYTPCKVTIPANMDVQAGRIVHVTDRNGKRLTVYVMSVTMAGNRMTVECFGNYRRDSTSVINEQSYKALSGKILNLKTTVEGVAVENKDTAGNVARLQLTVEGIQSSVSNQSGKITEIETEAGNLTVRVGNIEKNGVSKVSGMGYSFTDEGMYLEKDGATVKTRINNDGMLVSAYDEPVLQANSRGVVAVDVTVKNYLEIGHARFEEYSKEMDHERTACFWI